MTPAGWYDDPLTPGGKRFWDGNQWTDHVQGPPVAAQTGFGPASPGGPPSYGDPTAVGAVGSGGTGGIPFGVGPAHAGTGVVHAYSDGKVNDIGSWINRSFSMVGQQIAPLSVYLAIQFVVFAIAYVLLDRVLRNVSIVDGSDGLVGFEAGAAIIVAGLFVLSAFVGLVGLVASYHNLYGAHVGRPPSLTDSLVVGFARSFRYLGIGIVLVLAFYLIAAIAVGVVIGVGVLVGGDSPIVILLAVAMYIAFFVLMIFASVRLTFVPVAAGVVPAGSSALKAAWRAAEGRFWAVFGRVLLLGLVVGALTMIPYLVLVFLVPALLFSQFDLNSAGDFTIDGQVVTDLDVFEFSSILPNPVGMLAVFAIGFFLFGLIRAVSYSGTSALYADLGGLNSFGHRR